LEGRQEFEDRRKPEGELKAPPEESRPDASREEIRRAARESKSGANRTEISRTPEVDIR